MVWEHIFLISIEGQFTIDLFCCCFQLATVNCFLWKSKNIFLQPFSTFHHTPFSISILRYITYFRLHKYIYWVLSIVLIFFSRKLVEIEYKIAYNSYLSLSNCMHVLMDSSFFFFAWNLLQFLFCLGIKNIVECCFFLKNDSLHMYIKCVRYNSRIFLVSGRK